MIMPLENLKITSKYNVTRTILGKTSVHKGLDVISATGDKEIKAVRAGTYRGAMIDPNGFGNYVVVQHEDGIRTVYAHLESTMPNLQKGDKIEEGTVLGIEGKTGRATGVHLHIEAREYPYTTSNRIDIAEYLGIENEIGLAKKTEKAKAMEYVQEATGFQNSTMDFLDSYKFNKDLFIKLERAIKEGRENNV